MTDGNEVRLSGRVKRDASWTDTGRGNRVLDFALEVPGGDGRTAIFDCCATDRSDAFTDLEGFVEEGEEVAILGHLIKRTETKQERIAGVMVEVRVSKTVVYADHLISEE